MKTGLIIASIFQVSITGMKGLSQAGKSSVNEIGRACYPLIRLARSAGG
jgi:hypothetical protein